MSTKSAAIAILIRYLTLSSLQADQIERDLDEGRQSLNNVHASKWIHFRKQQGRWHVTQAGLSHFERDFVWKQLAQRPALESVRFSGEIRYFTRDAGDPDLSAQRAEGIC